MSDPTADQPAGALPEPAGGRAAALRDRLPALTPAEVAQRRRNRRWILVVALPAIVLGSGALLTSVLADRQVPGVRPLTVPSGYRAVSDGVFAYAVPAGWATDPLYSDDVGDLVTSGDGGWVGEHVGMRTSPPRPGETPPRALSAFGAAQPVSLDLGPAREFRLPGTSVAYSYTASRPGGFRATAIDAWQAGSSTEIWILVRAPATTTATILSSLTG